MRNQNKFHENQLLDKLKQNINAHTKNRKIKCKIRTIERVNAIIEKKALMLYETNIDRLKKR